MPDGAGAQMQSLVTNAEPRLGIIFLSGREEAAPLGFPAS